MLEHVGTSQAIAVAKEDVAAAAASGMSSGSTQADVPHDLPDALRRL